jgi:hypothetical protein
MPINLNNAPREAERTTIPEGLYRMRVKTSGKPTCSKSGNLNYLKLQFEVIEGQHRGAVIFDQQNIELADVNEFPPSGEQLERLNKAIEIGLGRVRAIVEGARSINPSDDCEDAANKRNIDNWAELDGMQVLGRVVIRPPQDGYAARNEIRGISRPGDRDWPDTITSANTPSAVAPPSNDLDDEIPF